MINSIEVINYLGESEVFELARPEKLGLAIKNIDGLGPGKANVNTTAIASYDGSVLDTVRLGNRNIVITFLMLQYENTIEQARLTTYKYFPIKKEVTLIFHTDSRDVSIKGIVESNEPNIFSKDEETKISIVCPDPYFYDLGSTKQSFSTLSPLFEFPFECNMGDSYEETKHEDNRYDSYHINTYSFESLSDIIGWENNHFYLKRDLTWIKFTLETYSYYTASGSTSKGQMFYNGESVIWNSCPDITKGSTDTHDYTVQSPKAGDTFYTTTPNGEGYPEQILTIEAFAEGSPLVFGNIEQFAEGNIVYTGDADTGVIIRIHALGTARNITIFNLSTSERFSISDEAVTAIVGSSITAGDDIEICTMVGQKSITLSRAGTTYNILNAVDKNSDWFMLRKGDNIFSYTVGVGETSDLQFVIESNILYEGI